MPFDCSNSAHNFRRQISRLAPLFFGLFLALHSSLGDKLNLSNRSDISPSADLGLTHQSDGIEMGALGVDDSSWSGSLPNPTQPEMKVVTNPYGVELRTDGRPLNSETVFHALLSAVDRNNANTVISTTTNRIQFGVLQDLDPQRLYIGKLHRDAQWNPSGQDMDYTTNLVSGLGGRTFLKFFYVNWPGITNLISENYNGWIDVSCVFTNQQRTFGNKATSTNDVSANQVSGLEYVVTSGTNNDGPTYISQGTNLVYAPSLGFVGTNNVNVQLRWPVGSTNVLGDINYEFIVTNMNNAPVISNLTVSGPKGITITNAVPASDPDGDSLTTYVAQQGTNGLVTILNGTNFIYAPNTNLSLNDSFRLYVLDGFGGSSATNDIVVTLTNRPPVAPPQTNTVAAETSTAVSLNAYDPDGDGLSYAIVSQPTNGNLSGSGSNRFYESPKVNWYGQDVFSYSVNDGYANSVTGSVTLIVTPLNRQPYFTSVNIAGTNVNFSAMVQPYRLLSVQSKVSLKDTNWLAESSEQIPYSTNLFVPWTSSLPKTKPTNFFRLENKAN